MSKQTNTFATFYYRTFYCRNVLYHFDARPATTKQQQHQQHKANNSKQGTMKGTCPPQINCIINLSNLFLVSDYNNNNNNKLLREE
jgi:hypothetical protein